MAIHFRRQVYIVSFLSVAPLQTAMDSSSTPIRTAPDAWGSPFDGGNGDAALQTAKDSSPSRKGTAPDAALRSKLAATLSGCFSQQSERTPKRRRLEAPSPAPN
jgi:hypothetical protein